MFRPGFAELRSKFNDFRDDIIEVVESLEPKEFAKFADKFAFNLPYIKKNLKLQPADLEDSTKLFSALLHNNLYSIFDVAVFDEMSKCLPKARKELKERVVENLRDYKECELQPVLKRTMSELAKDADVVYTHNDLQEHINLAFVFPKDPNFEILLEAREYLEDMNIHNVSNLRMDYGCVIVVFTITYPLEDLGDLAGKLSLEHHRQKLEQFGISRVFLLSHWGMEVDDGAVCHFKEVSYCYMCCVWCICLVFSVHVWCLVYMCGVRCTCVVFGVHVWCLVYMCGVWCTCVVFGVHVWCLVYMCGVRCTCVVFGVHVWCLVYMCGVCSTCVVFGGHVWCSVYMCGVPCTCGVWWTCVVTYTVQV